MSATNRSALGFVAGIGAGLDLRKNRMAEKDRARKIEREDAQRKDTQAFIDAYQQTFNPDVPSPGAAPAAPVAPTAPAAAIPPTGGTTPATTPSTTPAAPAAAPAAAPKQFARRQDILRLEAMAFTHAAKYAGEGGDPMVGIEAVTKLRDKLRRDGLTAFQGAKEAFLAGDYAQAAELSQLASSYSPDGYIPTFKQGPDGKLYVRFANEISGKPVGNPIPVTKELFDTLEKNAMSLADRQKLDIEAREQTRKEKDTQSNVEYRAGNLGIGQQNADTYAAGTAGQTAIGMFKAVTDEKRADAAMVAAKNKGKGSAASNYARVQAGRKWAEETVPRIQETASWRAEKFKVVEEHRGEASNLLQSMAAIDTTELLKGDYVPNFSPEKYLSDWAELVAGNEEQGIKPVPPAQATMAVMAAFMQERAAQEPQYPDEEATVEAAPPEVAAPPAMPELP